MRLSNAVVDSLCVMARVFCGAETVRTYVHKYLPTYVRTHVRACYLIFC